MQFGYFTLTDTPPAYGTGRRNPQQFIREVLHEALLAEELGFNSVWVPEHHFGLFGCLPTPAVFLAHVAAKTTRIKLAPATMLTALLVRGEHHPLLSRILPEQVMQRTFE